MPNNTGDKGVGEVDTTAKIVCKKCGHDEFERKVRLSGYRTEGFKSRGDELEIVTVDEDESKVYVDGKLFRCLKCGHRNKFDTVIIDAEGDRLAFTK